MTQIPHNFNKDHPELCQNEVFIGNMDDTFFHKLPYRTRRRGNIAYMNNGTALRITRPVFVERSEIERHPTGTELIWSLYHAGLWVIRYNHNRRHPELKAGEIFLCNDTGEGYRRTNWKTKRAGTRAFGPAGRSEFGVKPVFVRRKELESCADGQRVLKQLLKEGII